MRKRTLAEIWDKIFWGIIYLLPIIIYMTILALYKPDYQGDFSFFITLFNDVIDGFMSSDNPIYLVFEQVLGGMVINDEGWIMFGWYSPIIGYLTYCALISIAHVFFDIMVFIPRLAHKWLGKSTQQD